MYVYVSLHEVLCKCICEHKACEQFILRGLSVHMVPLDKIGMEQDSVLIRKRKTGLLARSPLQVPSNFVLGSRGWLSWSGSQYRSGPVYHDNKLETILLQAAREDIQLFTDGGLFLCCEGTTQGDSLANQLNYKTAVVC